MHSKSSFFSVFLFKVLRFNIWAVKKDFFTKVRVSWNSYQKLKKNLTRYDLFLNPPYELACMFPFFPLSSALHAGK